ncbi:MAG: HD domain-containing protein [Oscillospiraceae bacterium]|nr:HD domain-containing protein [Oscillospiraceae bacterium]
MKNAEKQTPLSLASLLAGALGCILYLSLRLLGTDSRGFIQTGHPVAILLFLLTAATLVGLAISLRQFKGTPSYNHIFPADLLGAIGHFVAAGGALLTGILTAVSQADIINILGAIAGILAAGSFVYMGLCRMEKLSPNFNLYIAVVPFFIFNLVSQYRFWSNEPEILRYVFLLLGNIFLMITVYYRACLFAGRNARSIYAFFHCGSIFFCGVCTVGANRFFYLCMLLWLFLDWFSLSPKKAAIPMVLPRKVLTCLNKLEENGFSAYVVGGCVRDFLLGLRPHDYDLCTDATPEQIASIFSKHNLVRSGEKHGTIGVVMGSRVYEITTFRTEGGYADSRHPDWVNFVSTVEEDLARRDFTVNAIAYSPSCGYVDPWDGQVDLASGILRAVGDPTVRFREDPLRILRGVRFAVTYNLDVEKRTEKAMLEQVSLMDTLARERVFSELSKLLLEVSAQDLLRFTPVITQIIPELAATVGFDQHSPHHRYDVFTHIAHTVAAAPKSLPLRLAALIHDVGKPATFTQDESGTGHFYGHAKVGGAMAEEILARLKVSNTLRKQVLFLVGNHMVALMPEKRVLRRHISRCGEHMILMLLCLQEADFASKGTNETTNHFSEIRALLAEIREEDACLSVKDLAVDGHDLMDLGLAPGPHIGQCLNELLRQVQNETLANTKEDLIAAAKEYFAG